MANPKTSNPAIEPTARRLDEFGVELPSIDDDWIMDSSRIPIWPGFSERKRGDDQWGAVALAFGSPTANEAMIASYAFSRVFQFRSVVSQSSAYPKRPPGTLSPSTKSLKKIGVRVRSSESGIIMSFAPSGGSSRNLILQRNVVTLTPIFHPRRGFWNSRRGTHLGQRSYAAQKAGHMIASDPIKTLYLNLQAGGRPHMGPGQPLTRLPV